jgi:hypothetical protein
MKRVNIGGLCVAVAVALAISMLGAVGASALPEIGRCVAKLGGKYVDANCTEKAGKNPEEQQWEFVKGAEKLGFTSSGGESTLEGASGTAIKCATQAATGEYLEKGGAIKEVHHVVITFEGCELPLFGAECKTAGAAAGEIVTTKLKGPLKYTSGKGTKAPVVNQGLKPEVAKKGFAQFECPAVGVMAYVGEGPENGHETILANVAPLDTMSSTFTEEYKGAKGVQQPQNVEGSTAVDNLETSLAGVKGEFERSDEVLTTTVTSEEALEVKAGGGGNGPVVEVNPMTEPANKSTMAIVFQFKPIPVNTTEQETLEFVNKGPGAWTPSQPTTKIFGPAFTAAQNCTTAPVNAGQKCIVTVTFAPTIKQAEAGVVFVGPTPTLRVLMKGTGT